MDHENGANGRGCIHLDLFVPIGIIEGLEPEVPRGDDGSRDLSRGRQLRNKPLAYIWLGRIDFRQPSYFRII